MKRKKWMIGIAAVLLTVFAAKGIMHYHWSQLSTKEKAGTITTKMARHFDLTEGQHKQLYTLNVEKITALETARDNGSRDRHSWKQLRQEWRSEVREILSPEQREHWK